LASGRNQGFRKKRNTPGFAWEFLWSGQCYRPVKSHERCGKSSSLHSKIFFSLGDVGFREWRQKWWTFRSPWPTWSWVPIIRLE